MKLIHFSDTQIGHGDNTARFNRQAARDFAAYLFESQPHSYPVVHHHPFYYRYSAMPDVGDTHPLKHLVAWLTRPFRRIKDAYSLCQIIRDRVDVLLFGHMHEGLDCSSESVKYGVRLALDGSSTTDTDHAHDRMRYRIIDLPTLASSMRMVPLT